MITPAILEARNAVCAAPGDDDARTRLVQTYADAGDEPRSALIRIQLERAALEAHERRAVELDLAARALLGEHEARWRREELPPSDRMRWGPFERGMVRGVWFDSPALLAKVGPECAKLCPLTHLVVDWPYPDDPPLPAMPNVRELTLTGTVYRTEDLARLVEMPLFASVRGLTLLDANLRGGLEALSDAGLEALRLPYHQLPLSSLAPLIDAGCAGLRELVLEAAPATEHSGSGDDGHRPALDERAGYALALWPGLSTLESLDLSGNPIGVEGLSVLLASPRSNALRRLRLARMPNDVEWDDALVGLRQGSTPLAELDVCNNRLHSEAVEAIAQSDRCRALRALSLSTVGGDLGPLRGARCWKSLEVLACDEASLPLLLDEPPPRLHSLVVNVADLDATLDALARVVLPNLLQLELRGVRDLSAVFARLDETSMPSLRALRVPGRITVEPEDLDAFRATPLGAALVSLDLDDPDLAVRGAYRAELEGDPYGAPGYQGPLRRLS
ncbi:MAG: hypothetical protein AB8I08_10135 [Sandaracinaceae bacterium]